MIKSNHHYQEIPTWNNGIWTTTKFETQEQFKDFLIPLFKIPGTYQFDETSFIFNEQARHWKEFGHYCMYKDASKEGRQYWDNEKAKCRFGVIYKHNDKIWYLTREYYMLLNFLQINDKLKKKFDFPEVWDGQYHMALYELLAELHYKHCAIVKKRQFLSSYFHMAKLINLLWFEETPILKMGAALKDFINEKGTWRFLNEYRSFLNKNTAWYRPMTPGKVLMWQQQIEKEDTQGRLHMVGLKGTLQGTSFEQDPTNGVGGACRVFFHEEAGIAPKMDTTTEYLFPAMELGDMTTGIFIAAGSVGDLTDCEPLKRFVYYPEANNIYPVTTNLLDEKGTVGTSGLFIPEQWCMPPYIDDYGNSLVDQALASLENKYKQWKKDLSPEIYQLRISQHPRNLAEAFAFREVSIFPQHLVSSQVRRIEEKEYSLEYLDIFRDEKGLVDVKPSHRVPITEFPITKNTEDKQGVLVVAERPIKGSEWGTYYAGIDPVAEGKTTTSESLCTIYIYKNPVEVTKKENGEIKNHIERDKIVAWWTGRFDDINKTHERLELILEWYNAWAVVENNVMLFIVHMINRNKQRYLVPKNQMMFLKEISANLNVYQEYGWRNVGTIFKTHIISYFIEFLKEHIDEETKPDGTIVKIVYGIERIPDIMVMKEMQAYTPGLNVDRLVAIASLIAFAKVQQANRGYTRRFETDEKKNLEKSQNLYKLDRGSPFRHMGKNYYGEGMKPVKLPFKNLR